jgi:transcriptional regulator with XRE-family HTH domain
MITQVETQGMGAESEGAPIETSAGTRVRAVRELSGMSRTGIARATGMTRRELAAIERGTRALTLDEARALAGALGVERDAFVTADIGAESRESDTATRIDDIIGHDPDHWDELSADPADLPPALPFDLPESERRADHDTRKRIDRSWATVRGQMDDVLVACAKVSNASSGDDMRALLKELEATVDRLSRRSSFQRHTTRHNTELEKLRNAKADVDEDIVQHGRSL